MKRKETKSTATTTTTTTAKITTMDYRYLALQALLLLAFVLIFKETLWQTKEAIVPRPTVSQHVRTSSSSSSSSEVSPYLGTKTFFRPPMPSSKVMTLKDMPDLANFTATYGKNETVQQMTLWREALQGRERVVEILHRAGVKFNLNVLKLLPTWSDVTALYGERPVILGLETCPAFRQAYPPSQRFVGIAGQHNCGTNAMAKYMTSNLIIPQNQGVGRGVLAQVPWHKHGWVNMRSSYMFTEPNTHEAVLPVIIVRDPYYWMHSMCESPYLMKWPHNKSHCPNLVKDLQHDVGIMAKTRWGKIYDRKWDSLAHVWSEFNGEYHDAGFPRLIIRFEDILFHTPEVLEQIRQCVDARWQKRFFVFSPAPAKQRKYFTDIKPQTSMLSAIIKYGQDHGQRLAGMTEADIEFARRHLDAELMEALHYKHPENLKF